MSRPTTYTLTQLSKLFGRSKFQVQNLLTGLNILPHREGNKLVYRTVDLELATPNLFRSIKLAKAANAELKRLEKTLKRP